LKNRIIYIEIKHIDFDERIWIGHQIIKTFSAKLVEKVMVLKPGEKDSTKPFIDLLI